MYRTSLPATASTFLNRTRELAILERAVSGLVQGAPSWVAIIGSRKIGKTSLVSELARRSSNPSIAFVVFDVQEAAPVSLEIFRQLAIRAVDALLHGELDVSLEALAGEPRAMRAGLQLSKKFSALAPALRTTLLELPDRPLDAEMIRRCLDLPEKLARALDTYVVVAIDEIQELVSIPRGKTRIDPFALMRSLWQKHERVSYIISGSARAMLHELVTSPRSPFFQHFSVLELEGFAPDEAARLLTELAPKETPIDEAVSASVVELLGGHPFYLQVFGEEMTQRAGPHDGTLMKEVAQDLLFSRTGRLSLFFENELARIVGRASWLLAVLTALAEGPKKLMEIAQHIGAPSGSTVRYIERLGDAVTKREDGRYALFDPAFGLWLRWRAPGGTAVPMKVIGDEAEAEVATYLARLGFDLIYQSRASRGAFDLLATRGAVQVGIQVKRAAPPLHFSRAAWTRMEAEAKRFGWSWVIAAVSPGIDVTMFDPRKARRTKSGVSVSERAAIPNLLAWSDQPSR